ncbi:hypothetical protein [Sporosarcina psychrophila]|uniref:Uncharacterized protein n=1 Tax=Sporosarcina psychrophila TaxID=1476 RepID=A0ABV2KBE7_SPOPS
MKLYAQILYNRAHWIFESEERPEYDDSIVLVDITGRGDVKEGWDYDSKTGVFTEPVYEPVEPIEPQPTQEEIQTQTLLNTEYLVIMSELTNL